MTIDSCVNTLFERPVPFHISVTHIYGKTDRSVGLDGHRHCKTGVLESKGMVGGESLNIICTSASSGL
jgi:hypothetical protein